MPGIRPAAGNPGQDGGAEAGRHAVERIVLADDLVQASQRQPAIRQDAVHIGNSQRQETGAVSPADPFHPPDTPRNSAKTAALEAAALEAAGVASDGVGMGMISPC